MVALEGHGSDDESGFLVANGAHCSWSRLKEFVTPLNIASGFNIILVLAACFGGSFARAIRTVDRAPVLGLIGPKKEVQAGQLELSFVSFYRTYFESLSLRKAIEELNATAPDGLYYRTSAQQFFYEVWARYRKVQCTKKAIKTRVGEMYRKLKAQKLPVTPSMSQLKRLIRDGAEESFEKYRDIYFMYDLDEANREKFPVTFKEAESYAAR